MFRNPFQWLLIATFTGLTLYGVAQPVTKADGQTLARLNQFRTAYTNSLLAGTCTFIQDYYADSVRLMPEYQKTVKSKFNARLYYQSFLARFRVLAYSRQDVEVFDLGTRVVEVSLFTMNLVHKSSGQQHELQGKYLTIWSQSATGQLLLLTEAWNYNHPVPWRDELLFAEVPVINVALDAHVPVSTPLHFELAALNLFQEAIISQHDERLWAQFYTDDARFLYSHNRPYSGRLEIDAFLKEHVKQLPVFEKLAIRNDQIDDSGRFVIEYASHIAVVKNGDWSGVGTGKDIRIWRREPGGALKIFRHMAMYD
ncbi:hypothetical protein BN8_01413 [Fibrisoma limi BUZ 3]|uniref:Uncharacterized protein n=1 Tax=Fibrisoma limi BUZ 3 TaxID=1185876 RepID=I2GET6_9BACT|nr:nuclear transport factor 2 family protein [Fibrisoma limi]CCH52411.1 hypothetical protein BN8_01413 [Fibrisoma limi BUZ 3]